MRSRTITRATLTAAFVAAVIFAACAQPPPPSGFKAGQVWQYHTRSVERGSRVIIGHIEYLPEEGAVVHIKLIDIRLRAPAGPGGYATVMAHAPITEAAFKASVTKLDETAPDLRGFQQGYENWRNLYRRGEAGVFDIPLAEIVDEMEGRLNP